MLAKDERKAMLLRLFNDDTPLKDRSKERFAARPVTANTQDENTNTSPSKSTSNLRGTTAERAKVHYHTAEEVADEFPEEEEEKGEEEEEVEGGLVGENEAEAEAEAEEKKIEKQEDEGINGAEDAELNIGSGEGIMRIGGRD